MLEECRVRKEALNPNTRRIVIDLDTVREGWGTVTVPVADYYERCRPLVDETLHVVEDLLEAQGGTEIEALYVTGGGSELPIVGRVLREQFGKRIRRSVHARSATALGLAIQADAQAGYVLREKFTRYFGVWREGDAGTPHRFRSAVSEGRRAARAWRARARNPTGATLRCTTSGTFAIWSARIWTRMGSLRGDVTLWDAIQFPFDPALRDADSRGSGALPGGAVARDRRDLFHRCQRHGHHYHRQSHGRLQPGLSPGPLGFQRRAGNASQGTHAACHSQAGRGPPAVSELLDLIGKHKLYDLAHSYFAGMPHFPTHPPFVFGLTRKHGDMVFEGGASSSAESIALGGHVGTHIDALCHYSCDGKLHGGVEASAVQNDSSGFSELGAETIAPILRRGVLLDIAAQMKLDALPPDFAITPEHLDAALQTAKTTIEPGDVVLLRTGWARYFTQHRAIRHRRPRTRGDRTGP